MNPIAIPGSQWLIHAGLVIWFFVGGLNPVAAHVQAFPLLTDMRLRNSGVDYTRRRTRIREAPKKPEKSLGA